MTPPISPTSTNAAVPAVKASNTGSGGLAVYGHSASGHGVEGASEGSKGVVGTSNDYQGVYGHSVKNAGVVGESATWVGVYGSSLAPEDAPSIAVMGAAEADGHDVSGNGTGVLGASTHGHGVRGTSVGSKGVVGTSNDYQGVYGHSVKNAGVVGESDAWVGIYGTAAHGEGVHGETTSIERHAGVSGIAANEHGSGPGVFGQSRGGPGMLGHAAKDSGVVGLHGDPHLQETAFEASRAGVFGASEDGPGVIGYARNDASPAVVAHGGVFAAAEGHALAGQFNGDVEVDGDLFLPGADCAEHFDVTDAEHVDAGAVVVIDGDGSLKQTNDAYDRRVAGVVSGAGKYRPALILDKHPGSSGRLPIALLGKVYCKVDARYSPIEAGDLLTTSATPGHAMKAADPLKAVGAVIGKALRAWDDGSGLIPILVTLR